MCLQNNLEKYTNERVDHTNHSKVHDRSKNGRQR